MVGSTIRSEYMTGKIIPGPSASTQILIMLGLACLPSQGLRGYPGGASNMTHQRLTSLKCPSLTGADWLGLGYQILSYGQFAYNRDSGHGSQFLLEWSPAQICHRPICPSLHFAKVAKVAL